MADVLMATLILAVVISVNDDKVALVYAVVASQANTLAIWFQITVAMLAFYIYRAVAHAVRG